MATIPTPTLITELLSRYQEGLFIGIGPQADAQATIGTIQVNGVNLPETTRSIIDLNHKIGKTLPYLLRRILSRLPPKPASQAPSTPSDPSTNDSTTPQHAN